MRMTNPRAGHWSYQWYEMLMLYVIFYGYPIVAAVVLLAAVYFLWYFYKE